MIEPTSYCPQVDVYTFAPGDGQIPVSFYNDPCAEELSFPAIYCGQKRPDNSEREVKVHYSHLAKAELRNKDRRAAQSIPNIFFKMKKIQTKQISDKVSLALRRCKKVDRKVTAAEALNPSHVDKLVNLDEGFYIFRTLRNSPPYLEKRKKDLFALIRSLGLPTWFCSLSAGDTRWKDLLRTLGKLIDGKTYSDDDIDKMTWNEKSRLVKSDPVTCARHFDNRVQQFINSVLKSDLNPVGPLEDFFYRVEFQHRGSPHIHMLMWISNAPQYGISPDLDVTNFVDKFSSCSSVISDNTSFIDVQTHKHSRTCRKKGNTGCRFGFPLPPLPRTMILKPLEQDRSVHRQKYSEIQQKLDTLTNASGVTYADFLDDLNITEEEYISSIQSSLKAPKLFLKRTPGESRINPYMTALLHTWNANHDLQFVLDPYACAVYIVAYISKSQREMSLLLDEACKEARNGNLDLKHAVRHIGNKFLNSVEVSAQEAAYLVLQLPITKSSRDIVFINTAPENDRIILLKNKESLEALPPQSTDIEADSMIKRYSKRPKVFESMCLADYVSELEIKFPSTRKQDEVNDDQLDMLNSDSDCEVDKTDLQRKCEKVQLKNGIVIKRRKRKRIIRYIRYNKNTNPEDHYREKLLLFLPWRKEKELLSTFQTYQDHYSLKRTMIDTKCSQYEHHAQELDQAMQRANEDLAEMFEEVAPQTEQLEAEDNESNIVDSDMFVFFKPQNAEHMQYDIGADIGVPQTTVSIEMVRNLLPSEEYLSLLRKLNIKQREFFNHVVHWIKTKGEPLYAFLTGGAGVGKSVVIQALEQALRRYLSTQEGTDPDLCRVLLLAPTGKAAHHINGTTIHAAFKILPNRGFNAYTVDSSTLNNLRVQYRDLQMVIIDEVSMVGNRMLSIINECLQKIKGNPHAFFGGVSIILIGDLFQLKPVMDGWIFHDLIDGMSSLATNIWRQLFPIFELVEIMRQKEDKDFAELLNRLRSLESGNLSDSDLTSLQTRLIKQDDINYPMYAPHLFTTNQKVDNFNKEMFQKSNSVKVEIPSLDTVHGDFSKSLKDRLLLALPNDTSKTGGMMTKLPVSENMVYEITANLNISDGLVNGASCIVHRVEYKDTIVGRPSIIWVEFENPSTGTETRNVYKHLRNSGIEKTWTPIFDTQRSFLYNRKTYIRIQFPLRPASARTIHKSQGSTLGKVVVDMSSSRKQPHMHYVAFSRVRNLSDLYILNLNEETISVDKAVSHEMTRMKQQAQLNLCYTPPYNLPPESFKIGFLNVRSLLLHHQDMMNDYNITGLDVLSCAETKLKQTIGDDQVALNRFSVFRMDEQTISHPHHGLAYYYSQDVNTEKTRSFSSFEFECMSAVISKHDKSVQLFVAYKSPRCSQTQLYTHIEAQIELDIDKPFIIMGDFNIDVQQNITFQTYIEQKFHCHQVIHEYTTDQKSTLDLIFTNIDDVTFSVIECCWTDHSLVYVAF